MKIILQRAAETIYRLGRAAQDCKSCARLPLCNAYRNEEGEPLKSCDYKWQYADIAEKIYNPEEQDDENPS